MPTTDPLKELIRLVIRQELLKGDDPLNQVRIPGVRKAFIKTEVVQVENVPTFKTTPGQLPEPMEDLVDALAEAFSRIIKNLRVVGTSVPLGVTIPALGVPIPNPGTTVPVPTSPATPNVVLVSILP